MLIRQRAFSIIEIILAMAIFVILTASSISIIISSFLSSRVVKEEQQAMDLAIEGMNVVEAFRDQDWDNLAEGDYGLALNDGEWQFSGGSDTDSSGKYTRIINISAVERDIDGEIITVGITDEETKLVTVDIAWDFNPGRPKNIVLEKYLTNWQESQANAGGGGGTTISTCAEYCSSLGTYSSGICRLNRNKCTSNGEVFETVGDSYCTVGKNDTCCCVP